MATAAKAKQREREAINRIASMAGVDPATLTAGKVPANLKTAVILERLGDAMQQPKTTATAKPKTRKTQPAKARAV